MYYTSYCLTPSHSLLKLISLDWAWLPGLMLLCVSIHWRAALCVHSWWMRGWADMSLEGGRVSRPTIVPLLPPHLPLLRSELPCVRRPAALFAAFCLQQRWADLLTTCLCPLGNPSRLTSAAINNTPGTGVVTKHNEFHFSGNHVFDLAGLSLRWIVWINKPYCTLAHLKLGHGWEFLLCYYDPSWVRKPGETAAFQLMEWSFRWTISLSGRGQAG